MTLMPKKAIYIIILLFIFTFLICKGVDPEKLDKLVNTVIFNSITVLVGILIAIIGIFIGSLSSINISIFKFVRGNKDNLSNDEIEKIVYTIEEIVSELKDNTILSLFSFIIIILLIFLKEVSVPYMQWIFADTFYTKEFALNHIILFLSSLIFYAIIDSTLTIFKIAESFRFQKS